MRFLLQSIVLALGFTSALAYHLLDVYKLEMRDLLVIEEIYRDLYGRAPLESRAKPASRPTQQAPENAAASAYSCRNIKSPGGLFRITIANAGAAIQAAGGTETGKTGYPHVFQNAGGSIKWPNARCNAGWHGPIPLATYEYPVLQNNQAYNKDANPRPDPGPARVIYLQGSNELCGVVSHDNGNAGLLRLCTNA